MGSWRRKNEKVNGRVVIFKDPISNFGLNRSFDKVFLQLISSTKPASSYRRKKRERSELEMGSWRRKNEKVNGRVVILSNVGLNRSFDGVFLQLISTTKPALSWERKGKVGKKAYLEKGCNYKMEYSTCEAGNNNNCMWFEVNFDWEKEFGIPGGFLIGNRSHLLQPSFFLKSLTIENLPGCGRIHFDCNSWIYHSFFSKRVFFRNKAYLPNETPELLYKYREDELQILRGNGTGERKKKDRIYDYDVYNDLGHDRPILGGSNQYPYPRRGRTGRKPLLKDGIPYESRRTISILNSIYVPSNEKFCPSKRIEFFTSQTKSQIIHWFDGAVKEVKSLQHLHEVHEEIVQKWSIPLPHVIQADKIAWRTDEEFAREMLAGENPVAIRRLKEFPPSSKLDPNVYGDQNSKITKEHIMNSLDGLAVHQAIKEKKVYILDHHDSIMPFLRRINSLSCTKTYATRTLVLLKDDGSLKPLVIELSLPHPKGDKFGAISRVVLPAEEGVHASIWHLAKTYVAVNDTGHHQLVSHWLNTHAVIEPFVIATNRQLSVLHPIHKLLVSHFKDTMKINAQARQSLINADGIIEKTHYPAKYSMEMSSFAYRTWVFPQQALPADLIERGVAIKDSSSPHGVRLLIEDYPYAVDGLEIWTAIETWVQEYCCFYYKDNEAIQKDKELQSWWEEVREKGHEDKKDEQWWPNMKTIEELINSCTIIIWISSALHAALNFGQYSYGGFFPNRPTTSKRLLPEEGTRDYEELKLNPEKALLKTICSKPKDISLVVSIIAVLSKHFSDEVYLGERSSSEWTLDKEILEAFDKFKNKLVEIEDMISKRNKDPKLKNRVGPANMPYTLLFPSSSEGITCKGIPNSISI